MSNCSYTVAVILAGGRSSRLSAPLKWQRQLGKQPLLKHIITRIEAQVDAVAINTADATTNLELAGINPKQYTILPDCQPGFKGPLIGLLSGLLWAKDNGFSQVLTVPCDMPFFPSNIYSTLSKAIKPTPTIAAIVTDGQQAYAVLGLWSVALIPSLTEYIINHRSINDWATAINAQETIISNKKMLMNINTEADLCTAQHYLTNNV